LLNDVCALHYFYLLLIFNIFLFSSIITSFKQLLNVNNAFSILFILEVKLKSFKISVPFLLLMIYILMLLFYVLQN